VGTASEALAINDSDVIGGAGHSSATAPASTHSDIRNGVIQDLGTLGGASAKRRT